MALVLAAVLVGLGAALLAGVAVAPRGESRGLARSLELARGGPGVLEPGDPADRPAAERLWRPLLTAAGALGARISPAGTPERMRRRIELLGNVSGLTVHTALAAKGAATLVLGGLGLLFWWHTRSALGALTFGLLAALGYCLVDLLIHNAGQHRQEAIRRAAPDTIDMMTVCVEAGLGLDAALQQVCTNTTGALSEELARVLREMHLGRGRTDALADLGARCDVTEVRTLVAAVVQADRLGVPIAGVLREQAAELRVRRRQRAEEKAQKVPVKILMPVLFCIFPVFFIIVIGPGVIRIAGVFGG
ncbi:type II secretion system F family protein [Spongisporangium articulatum]|uniref:Type II secretion system F family protein n=1 Tax=Spongisporangium articulatum TaxID=3362603 RepID=A0ABW8AIB1_9ACTN